MLLDRSRVKTWARVIYGGLALVFMLSFVIGGVGSGSPFSLSDVIGNNSANDTPTTAGDVSGLEKRTTANPQDADAWIALARAYGTAGRPEDEIRAYEKALALRKDDEQLLETMAGLYQGRAGALQSEAQVLQQQAAQVQAEAPATGPFSSSSGPLGPATQSPVQNIQGQRAQEEAARLQAQATQKSSEASTWFKKAFGPYQDLVDKHPKDARLWFRYGLAAYNANDTKLAKKALGQFVKLAPGDPQTPQIQSLLKQLDASSSSTTAGAGTTTVGG